MKWLFEFAYLLFIFLYAKDAEFWGRLQDNIWLFYGQFYMVYQDDNSL